MIQVYLGLEFLDVCESLAHDEGVLFLPEDTAKMRVDEQLCPHSAYGYAFHSSALPWKLLYKSCSADKIAKMINAPKTVC